MLFREASVTDIEQMSRVRLSVKENALSHPGLITFGDYEQYLVQRGRGWVCEVSDVVAGFAIADLQGHNIWALFVQPGYEGMGIGKRLQRLMLDWYFSQTRETVWLGTAPRSRAEAFYRRSGWMEAGRQPNGEIRFEMTYENWKNANAQPFSNTHR